MKCRSETFLCRKIARIERPKKIEEDENRILAESISSTIKATPSGNKLIFAVL